MVVSGPPNPGQDANETVVHNDREWSWDTGSSTWRPTEPNPFEIVASLTNPTVETYWEPVLGQWVPLGTVIDSGSDSGVVVRSYDEDELL